MQPSPSATPHDDDTLLAELGRVIDTVDPVPERVRIAARAALDWSTLDAEFAALVHDSMVDEPALAVRGSAGPRSLTFQARELEIEVDIEPEPQDDGTTLRLAGQLVPPQSAQIAIGTRGGLVLTRADRHGRFVARGVATGLVRLRCWLDCAPNGGRLTETPWLEI
jgi:hypothetical protein